MWDLSCEHLNMCSRCLMSLGLKILLQQQQRLYKGEGVMDHLLLMSQNRNEGVDERHVAALAEFRKAVRVECFRKENTEVALLKGAILRECDKMRDETLPPLGVQITDKGVESSWRVRDPTELLKEIEETKREALAAKQLKQQQQQQQRRQGDNKNKKKVGPEIPQKRCSSRRRSILHLLPLTKKVSPPRSRKVMMLVVDGWR
eukprot:gnl/Chilomastix_caulleri/2183.p1 GENE.gnl/Chilomastix_caulleri/2183~~gnl/Chilomastix_caulleri/2183.p1  ORF type:complete len:203 (+),score=63.19 gnl/Chilomastix_caulleri/2183:164-772(+)